ncbi:MAG TPA: hypothetical protein VKA53_04465, partial [Thermoanaerobaculia bacterium]|nr:hypothetical protein [Thermoanaerobaculia bacterium]
MMKVITRLFLIGLLLSLVGCPRRTSRTDSGGVLLSLTKFDALPVGVSVNGQGGYLQIGKLTLQNVPADPNGTTSSLMNVELDSYSVTFSRADQGTRVPPKLVEKAFGVVPVGGTDELDNFVMMSPDQFDNPPLSDLFYANGGYDKETGST